MWGDGDGTLAVKVARGASLTFVAGCFVVAALGLVDAEVETWAKRLVAPVTLALVHLGGVLAGRVWAVVAAVVVSLLAVLAVLVAGQLVLVVLFTGKKDLVAVPLIVAAYGVVVAVHLIVTVVAARRAERRAQSHDAAA